MRTDDHCLVGIIKSGFDYDSHWEVFETGDSEAARDMWRKLHGEADEDDLFTYSYNADEVARSYGLK